MVLIEKVNPSFCLHLDGKAETAVDEIEISQNWQQLCEQGHRLHDGPLMALRERGADRARVCSTSYRYLMSPKVSLKFLAVSAWVEFEGQVLLGQRSQHVNQYPGLWELAPAGSLDHVDYLSCLTRELGEELGIPLELIQSLEPIATCEEGRVVDILVKVYLRSRPCFQLNTELDAVQWLSVSGAREWALEHSSILVPMTRAALTHFAQ